MIESAKKEFLSGSNADMKENPSSAFESATIVGVSYFFGALVPMLPIILGAHNIMWPLVIAMVVMLFISTVIAFLSGMRMSKRIVTNLIILLIAVGVTYLVGLLLRSIFGLNV